MLWRPSIVNLLYFLAGGFLMLNVMWLFPKGEETKTNAQMNSKIDEILETLTKKNEDISQVSSHSKEKILLIDTKNRNKRTNHVEKRASSTKSIADRNEHTNEPSIDSTVRNVTNTRKYGKSNRRSRDNHKYTKKEYEEKILSISQGPQGDIQSSSSSFVEAEPIGTLHIIKLY